MSEPDKDRETASVFCTCQRPGAYLKENDHYSGCPTPAIHDALTAARTEERNACSDVAESFPVDRHLLRHRAHWIRCRGKVTP